MRRPPALAATAAFLIGAAMLSACGRGTDAAAQLSGPPQAAVDAPLSTTTTPATTAAPTLSTTTGPTATTRATGPTTTAPVAAATTTTPPAGIALTPPAAGTYHYDTVGQTMLASSLSQYPAVTSLVVDPPVGTQQHAVRNLQDALGNGPMLETMFDYRRDGIYLVDLKATIKVLLFGDTVELAPTSPVLLLPTGFRPGYHQELDMPAQGGTVHVVLDALRQEPVTVAGRAIDATVFHLVASLPTAYNARLDLTVWLAPSVRMWVREHLIADASAAGVTYHSEYDATIQSV